MIVIRLDQKALAALIEEQGEEFKLEITAATLEGATKRALKTVVTKDIQAAVDEAIKKQIDGRVDEEIGKINWKYGTTWSVALSDKIEKAVKREVDVAARRLVGGIITDEELKELIAGHVEAVASSTAYYVKRRLSKVTDAVIREGVERRVALALVMSADE